MPTIDIRTTQNVTIEYDLASMRERILGFLIDLIILGAGYIAFLLALLSTSVGEKLIDNTFIANLLFFILPLASFMFYHFISEFLAGGQSWGKKLMGMKVVRLDGREPSAGDYLLRAVFHLIDTLSCAGILAAIFISSTAQHQRLGDMTANTTVIRTRSELRFRLDDILRINSLQDYTPTYPQVQGLSEQDMLTIKYAISRYDRFPNEAHHAAIRELTEHLCTLLEIEEKPVNKVGFLKTLLRDYIVLTR